MRKNLPNPLSLRFVVPWQSFKYRAKNDAILFHGRVAGRMGRTAIVTSTREHRSFASHVSLVCCGEKVSYLKVKLPEMPSRCVVGGCSNTPDLERGIAPHTIPFHRYERPMAKKRRKRWVDFIKTKRAKWEPSKTSAICSAHFLPGDFQRLFSNLPGQTKAVIPRLNRDDLGVTVFPTIHPSTGTVSEPQSKRSRIKVRFECISCCIANRVNPWHVFIIFFARPYARRWLLGGISTASQSCNVAEVTVAKQADACSHPNVPEQDPVENAVAIDAHMRTTPNRKSQILSLGLTTSTRQSNSRLKSLKIIQHFWILPSTKATDLQRNQSLTFALISSRLKHFNIHTIVPATRRESWRASSKGKPSVSWEQIPQRQPSRRMWPGSN